MPIVTIAGLSATNELPRDQLMRLGLITRKPVPWARKGMILAKPPFTIWHPTPAQAAVREYVRTQVAPQQKGKKGIVSFTNKKGEKIIAPAPAKVLHDLMMGKSFKTA